MEMIFQPRQQIERLQAVDAESLEEVIVRRKLLARHLEVRGREAKNLVQRLVSSLRHTLSFLASSSSSTLRERSGGSKASKAAHPYSRRTSSIPPRPPA